MLIDFSEILKTSNLSDRKLSNQIKSSYYFHYLHYFCQSSIHRFWISAFLGVSISFINRPTHNTA